MALLLEKQEGPPCRKDAGAFQAALGDAQELIVACTQEAPLFGELAPESKIRFVNLREQAGWSAEGARATPKIAALVAMAALPEPAPVPAVEFKSSGQLLVIGPGEAALDWAERLCGELEVSVLLTGRGEVPLEHTSMHWLQPSRPERLWAQIFSRYLKKRGFSNSPTRETSLCAASACSSGASPGAK